MYAHGFGVPNYISKTMMYIHGLGAKVNFQGLFYTCTKGHVDKAITYVYISTLLIISTTISA